MTKQFMAFRFYTDRYINNNVEALELDPLGHIRIMRTRDWWDDKRIPYIGYFCVNDDYLFHRVW
jgi:hypothetical protein